MLLGGEVCVWISLDEVDHPYGHTCDQRPHQDDGGLDDDEDEDEGEDDLSEWEI